MPYKLQDLIDMAQFQGLQDRLNEIYSFPSAIIDNEGNILTATAWQDMCTKFHRVNKDSELECIKSDQYIAAHLSEANPAVSYRCPHGLVDNATPIIIEGVHYGNFFTGQFFLERPDLEFFRAQAKRYGFDEEAYLAAVKKVPVWSQAQLNSYLFFIKGLIEVISGIGLKNLREIEIRKQMEASEERADTILREMGDGFWVLNSRAQIMDVNDAMCQMVGYTRDELLGMTVAGVEANDTPEVIAQRTQLVVQAGSTRFESRFRRKDGSIIDVDISVTYLPERDLLFGFHRDITVRKQAEEAVRKERNRAQSYLDIAEVIIVAIRPDQNTLLVNRKACEVLEYEEGELLGKNWFEMVLPEGDRGSVQAEFSRLLAGAPDANTYDEKPIVTKSGNEKLIAWHHTVLRNEKGEVTGTLSSGEDITARRRAEQALSEERALLAMRVEERTAELRLANADLLHASRLKDEFLANMSHELRTPLTAILGLSEALQTGTYGPLPEKPNQMLQVIHKSGEHLLALITDILDLSKIEADKMELQLEPTAVEDICLVSLQFVRQIAQRKNIRVTYAADPQVRELRADGRRVKQMLVNLLGNAVKFTPEGGVIGLEVVGDPARHEVRFAVWDTGIGILPEKQAMLFQPFVQVDGSLARKYEGAGLGLALTRRLAEKHGGQVSIASAGTGQGSRFTITLPWHSAEILPLVPMVEKAPIPATLMMPSGRPAVILLADDNEVSLMTMGDFLESFSAKIMTACNGLEVLAQASAAVPDLILMDIQMPELNGLDAIRRLKSIPETRKIPIIALTALAMPGDRERCLKAGADDYLCKPVKLHDLLRVVGRHLKAKE